MRAFESKERSSSLPQGTASDQNEGLVDDLQQRGSIIFCDRFFDAATGNQIQDMHVSSDALPATVLMTNAMNSNAVLNDLLRQGDIPRLLNENIREVKNPKKDRDVPFGLICLLDNLLGWHVAMQQAVVQVLEQVEVVS